MASPEIEAQFKQVLARAQAVLKPLGFRKTGKRFWRVRDDGNLTDIGFQRSVSSDAVSILSKELLRRWDPEADILKHAVRSGHVGKRLGRFRADPGDHWWVLRQGVDADAIADEIATLIRTAVVPFLDRYGSDAGLLSLPQTGEAHIAQWLVDQLNAAASAEQA